jgi:tripartite-type tricarboxylate transporter receptor subunit TctC
MTRGATMGRRFFRATVLALTLCASPLASAGAAGYPERPIHVIVPYAGAGTMDIASRILFERIARTIGQPIVIENRPGAGGNIGLDQAAKAQPDGYTLVVADPMTSFSANVTLLPNLGFNPLKDFVPVANFGCTGAAIIVAPSLPAKTLAEFVALAKSRPGQLLYGSTGVGSPGHLNGEVFARLVGIKAVHVPYRNGGQGTTDLLAGRIHFWIAQIPTRLDQVRNGKLRALAVAGGERSPDLPEVPTVHEAGFGDFDASSDYAVFAPAGTPREAIDKLHAEIRAALQDPSVVAKLRAAGLEPKLMDSTQVTKVLQDQIARWADIVKAAHISVTGQ